MSDDDHKYETLDTLSDILNEIDQLPLHPKNKIRLYSQYALSKISWHFTVSDIGKTWVKETGWDKTRNRNGGTERKGGTEWG